jgi:hypothetical protein
MRTIFCLSVQGTVLLLFSVFIFIIGIVRIDLSALLWASAFFLITAYTLCGNNLLRIVITRYLDRQPDCVNIKLPNHGIYPNQTARASLKLKLPRFVLPGFVTRLWLKLVWQDHAYCKIEAVLSGGESSQVIEFSAPRRGEYKTETVHILVKDYLGLTRSSITLPVKEQVKVYPSLSPASRQPLKFEVTGVNIEYSPRKKTSDELLETRKYYPGDDVRRINWKTFARLRELFLRIGEDTTQPEAKLLCIIDPTRSPLVPAAVCHDYLDLLVREAGSLLVSLIGQGIETWLMLPGYEKAKALTAEKRELLLDSLARIRWQEHYRAMTLPPYKNLHALVFSSPGSPGLEPLAAQLKKRGLKISLFFPTFQATQSPPSGLTVKDILFYKKSKKHPRVTDTFDPRLFSHILSQETAKYRKAPWRMDHVYRI